MTNQKRIASQSDIDALDSRLRILRRDWFAVSETLAHFRLASDNDRQQAQKLLQEGAVKINEAGELAGRARDLLGGSVAAKHCVEVSITGILTEPAEAT